MTPIVFWIEKTVPYKYRAAVREGILEWNKAFEKAGFANAIEVRQQPDDATWDPEDINYNTFRWITSNAGFAMGPSRVNPMTGQILDADIIFDADFIEHWTKTFEIDKPARAARAPTAPSWTIPGRTCSARAAASSRHDHAAVCDYAHGMAEQLAFGAMALTAARPEGRRQGADREAALPGRQVGRHARSGPHARPAAQLQGQHAADAGRTQRPGEDPQRRPGRPR